VAHIRLEGLWFGYTPDRPVLKGINLEIAPGEFVALIGQNGAGKSTLAKHLNGVHRPTRGRVLLNGADIRQRSVAEIAAAVGYCYQNPDHQIFHTTMYDEVAFGPRNMGLSPAAVEQRVQEALSAVGLWGERQEPPHFAGKGERQRVAVASVLAMSPGVIVLDEPTTGLDWAGAREMMALVTRLHAEGRTIVMITHDMRLVADYADRVVVLGEGQVLLDGAPAAVLRQADVLRRTAVQAPQVVRLAAALRPEGPPALSVAQLVAQLEVVPGVALVAAPASAAVSPLAVAATAIAAAPAPTSAAAPGAPATAPARKGLHPTARLLTVAALTVLPFLVQAPWLLALVLGLAVGLARTFRLTPGAWRTWRALGLVGGAITFLMWLPFVPDGAPLFQTVIPGLGWRLAVTTTGLQWAAGMGLRIASASLICLAYIATTPPRQITAGLLGLGLPYPIAFLISLAFRLLPVSQRDALIIREVQAVRGLDINQGPLLVRARRYTAILGPLVLLALRRVQLIANALDARGFRLRGGRHRLYRMPAWRTADLAAIVAAAAALAGAITLRVYGIGILLQGRL
jgi:energy-coupling factor transport system ATP-binding protein